MTQRIVRVLLGRNREYTRAAKQIGKLLALNNLAANLAHELNNPKSVASQSPGTSASDQEHTHYRIGMALGTNNRLNTHLDRV